MIRLPKFLDRERRMRSLKIVAAAERAGKLDAFKGYTRKCAEVEALKRQIASVQERLAESRQETERLQGLLNKYERATPNA